MLILEVLALRRLWKIKDPVPDIQAFDAVNITTMTISAASVLVRPHSSFEIPAAE